MDKKSFLKILLIIIVMISICVALEIGIKKIITLSKNKIEQNEVHTTTVTQKQLEETREAFKSGNEIVNLLKNKEYESIYNRFPELYKEAKYPTLADFEESMNQLISDNSIVALTDYEKTLSGEYITVTVDDEKNIYLKINYNGSKNGTIVFDNLIDIYKLYLNTHTDKVNVEINYCVKYTDKTGYILEISNLTNQNVKINFADSYLHIEGKTDDIKYKLMNAEEIEIGANSTKRVEIQFPIGPTMFTPNELCLHSVINNTEIFDNTFYVAFDDIYWSD